MKKFLYITLLIISVFVSFKIGQKSIKISKYDYLNLHEVTKTEINGNKIKIHTFEGDVYVLFE